MMADYRELEATYRRRGWLLLEAEFPRVLVALATAHIDLPFVALGVALDYTNYDARPPSVRLVNPFTGEQYRWREICNTFRALPRAKPSPILLPRGPQVSQLMQAHDPDDIPFLCLAGVREYHDHPGHTGDSWERHRTTGRGTIVDLLETIHRYGVAAISGYGLAPNGQLVLGVNPAA